MPWNLLLPGAGISCPAALSAVANSGEYDCISDRSKNVSKLVVTTAGLPALLRGSDFGRGNPIHCIFHATRSNLGRPSSVIRLRTRTPIFASVF